MISLRDFFTIQSIINNWIIKGLGLKPNCLNTTNGIKLMLAPKSHKARVNLDDPIVQEIVKAPGSPFLYTRYQEVMTL